MVSTAAAPTPTTSAGAAAAGPSVVVDVPPIIQKLRSIISDPAQGWDSAWKQAATPWDRAMLNPALVELFTTTPVVIDAVKKGGRSLVAGCGRGNDAIYFATLGFDSLGIDLSPTAVEVAEKELATIANPPANVRFEQHDFFASQLLIPGSFALAYDYTFLCAIPSTLHAAWAARYAELIQPGGLLITLIFPIDGDRPGGPPYSVNPAMYNALLSDTFDRVYFEKPTVCYEGHGEKQMMAVWKRKSQ